MINILKLLCMNILNFGIIFEERFNSVNTVNSNIISCYDNWIRIKIDLAYSRLIMHIINKHPYDRSLG